MHQAVIGSDAGLREGGLRKMSILTEAISHGFLERRLDDLAATLAAHNALQALTTPDAELR